VKDRLPDDELALPPGASPDVDAKLVAALERVGQALRVQMWDKAKRHGLSPTQLQVLLRLAVPLGRVPHLHAQRLPDALEGRRQLGVHVGRRAGRQGQLVVGQAIGHQASGA